MHQHCMVVNDGFAVAAEGLGAAGTCLANAAFAAAIILLAAAATDPALPAAMDRTRIENLMALYA